MNKQDTKGLTFDSKHRPGLVTVWRKADDGGSDMLGMIVPLRGPNRKEDQTHTFLDVATSKKKPLVLMSTYQDIKEKIVAHYGKKTP